MEMSAIQSKSSSLCQFCGRDPPFCSQNNADPPLSFFLSLARSLFCLFSPTFLPSHLSFFPSIQLSLLLFSSSPSASCLPFLPFLPPSLPTAY